MIRLIDNIIFHRKYASDSQYFKIFKKKLRKKLLSSAVYKHFQTIGASKIQKKNDMNFLS